MAAPLKTLIRPVVARLAEDFGLTEGAAPEAMLVAIGLQESGFATRDQLDAGSPVIGPATGFWQFERAGAVRGVMRHPASRSAAKTLISESGTPFDEDAVWRLFARVEGDELACAFARLLLFTDPQPLPAPAPGLEQAAWEYYLRNWRPGRPRREHWGAFWREACAMVAAGAVPSGTGALAAFRSSAQAAAAEGGSAPAGASPPRGADLADRLARLEEEGRALSGARAAPLTRADAVGAAAAAVSAHGRAPGAGAAGGTGPDLGDEEPYGAPFDVIDAFERAAEATADVAVAAGPAPAAAAGDGTISFGPGARSADFTPFSRGVLTDIIRRSGLAQVVISSTSRSPAEQARVMFSNLERFGVAHQLALYGPAGDAVIEVYRRAKLAGRDAAAVQALMTDEVVRVGPTRVSRHAADPRVLNVFDVAPSSVARRAEFEQAVRSEPRVAKFITPPTDPGYHLEIPQP